MVTPAPLVNIWSVMSLFTYVIAGFLVIRKYLRVLDFGVPKFFIVCFKIVFK